MKSPAKPEPKARAVMGTPEQLFSAEAGAAAAADAEAANAEPGEPELASESESEGASASEIKIAEPEPGETTPSAPAGPNKPKIRRDGESRGKKRQGLEPNN